MVRRIEIHFPRVVGCLSAVRRSWAGARKSGRSSKYVIAFSIDYLYGALCGIGNQIVRCVDSTAITERQAVGHRTTSPAGVATSYHVADAYNAIDDALCATRNR